MDPPDVCLQVEAKDMPVLERDQSFTARWGGGIPAKNVVWIGGKDDEL
jgi:hypothetical protein